MKKEYRITTTDYGCGNSAIRIQVHCLHALWITVWEQYFSAAERDYALLCAKEIKEHLEEEI